MAAQSLSVLPVSPSSSGCRCRNPNNSPFLTPKIITSGATASSFTGLQLSIHLSSSRSKTSRRYSSVFATVSSSPTAPTPEKETSEKSAKWSFRFIKSFAMGELEARKLKYNNTGTESLLMGILVEGTSLAAKLLRESGVTLFKVREETVELLGKSDMYIFSPEHPPLTEAAQKAIDWAINEKLKSGETGEVTTSHLLLGIWAQKESAGHKIMATLGFDDDKAKELEKSVSSKMTVATSRMDKVEMANWTGRAGGLYHIKMGYVLSCGVDVERNFIYFK